jgi:serine/threonine protein kinase
MTKARRLGVPTPVLYAVDPLQHTLTFEYVDGLSVKDILLGFGSNGVNEERLNDIATQIGNALGKLHDGGLVHGDLTTSNMIMKSSNNQLVCRIFPVPSCFSSFVLFEFIYFLCRFTKSSYGNQECQPIRCGTVNDYCHAILFVFFSY